MINQPFMYAGGSSLANSNTGLIMPYFNAGGNLLSSFDSLMQKSIPKTSNQTPTLQPKTTLPEKQLVEANTKNCNCNNCDCSSKQTMYLKALALMAAGVAVGYFLIK